MLSALYAIARPSVTRVDQSKTVVGIMKFSPYGDKFRPEILIGFPEQGVKQGRGGKTNHF